MVTFISGEDINLRQLFDYIIYGDPNKTLNVISTNYDRIAEYAACQTDAYINIGFTHGLMGKLKDNIMLNPKKPEADYTGFINILKVHGSLDWYRRDGIICNIPNSVNIPLGFTPCIVTPGTNKYERTQEEPHRQLYQLWTKSLKVPKTMFVLVMVLMTNMFKKCCLNMPKRERQKY